VSGLAPPAPRPGTSRSPMPANEMTPPPRNGKKNGNGNSRGPRTSALMKVASATSTDVGRSLEEFIAQANGGAIEADGWALGEEARREVRRGDEPRAATRSRAEIEAAELARRKGEAELAAVKAQLAEAEARAAAAEARAQTVPDLDEATTTAPRMARPSSLPGVPPMP